ncbi:MAG: PTS sugar transporter subunit IIA [Betaproteobacteria bacterium]|nr:PTS sugar transporter subunit IIA [Betaproteobacteria bacterium]
MNVLAKHLSISHVALDLDITSKKRLFEQIGLIFENEDKVARAQVFDALFAREKLGSTGLGFGVAIPHGRIKNLRDTLAVFIRAKAGIPFEAPDGNAVRLVFAMLVPEHATEQHLNLLSELAQMFSDAELRLALEQESDPAIVHRLLTEWSPFPLHAQAKRSAAV